MLFAQSAKLHVQKSHTWGVGESLKLSVEIHEVPLTVFIPCLKFLSQFLGLSYTQEGLVVV